MRLPAFILVCAVSLAACGTNLSRQEFVERADRACADTGARLASLSVTAAPSDRLVAYSAGAHEILHDGAEELKRIVPPRDDAADYGEMLDHQAAIADKLGDLGEAGREDDEEHAAELPTDITAESDAAAKLAARLGLERCATAATRLTDSLPDG